MLNTGTAKYGISLWVPPGTRGQTPALVLRYEGGSGNGPLGFGWSVPVPFIQRQCDKGIPRYVDNMQNGQDDDYDGEIDEIGEVDRFINETKEELVPQADGRHFSENEGVFIRYRRQGDAWEGTLPNGTRLQFGLTPSGRITDPATGHVFKWLLERETDTHGNVIAYSYSAFAGAQNTNQKFLTDISYGPGSPPWNNFHFVTFIYEDRPDWFEDCRSGFIVRTGKRLKEIVIGTQGPLLPEHLAGDFNADKISDNLNRKYKLGYHKYAAENSHWSLLAEVQSVGADGATTLPASSFGYTVCNPPDVLSARDKVIGGISEPIWVMDNELVDFVDLNGDALPDILKTEYSGGRHSGVLNRGQVMTSSGPVIQWAPPKEVASADELAWGVNLESPASIAHLADMDGDGLSDLVVKSLAGDVHYFRNEGKIRWSARKQMSILDFAPPSPFGDPNVKTADVDFDKRMDVVQSIAVGPGADYRIWFNRDNQRYSYSVTVSQSSGFMFAQPGVHIADFNGDRVPDVVWLQPSQLTVTAGLGHGSFASPIIVRIHDAPLSIEQVATAKLQDITGDGLVDLVLEHAAPGQFWYWINLGNYTLGPRRIITEMPENLGQNPTIRWADLNGNGTTDLIYADGLSEPRLRTVDIGELIGCVPHSHLLTSIANGIGRITTIHYETSVKFALEDAGIGRSWPDSMPFPMSVVTTVTNSDSLGHFYVTRFRYHDGYYDSVEREFRGFARVEVVETGDATAPTLITRSHFDTGRRYEAMKGKLLRVTTEQEDGKVFSDETTSWTDPPVILHTGTNRQTVNFAHPTGCAKLITELGQGAPRHLESEFAYDHYGNQTTNAAYGIVENGNRGAFDDERIITTTYASNTEAWLIRSPIRSEISDEHGNVISRTELFYDDETFSGNNLGQLSLGNLTMKREWIWPQTNNAFVASARTKYDAFGNPVVLLDPLAEAPSGTLNLNKGHVRQVDYDSRFHTYAISETIHIGMDAGRAFLSAPLVFQATYNEGLGSITSSTDFNSNMTGYGHDTFGRLTSIVEPGDSPEYPTVEYDYALAVPFPRAVAGQDEGMVNYIETRRLDKMEVRNPKTDMYFRTRQFIDGLGRALMTKTEAEPASSGGPPRVAVTGAVLFNARQQPFLAVNPFFTLRSGPLDQLLSYEEISAQGWQGQFQNESTLVALDLPNAHSVRTHYDATLRPVKITNPDGTFRRSVHEPLVIRSFDENDNDSASPHFDTPMVHHTDGLERLVRVDEITRLNDDGTPADTLRAWTTRYDYDLNDQLRFITDSQMNLKEFRYDSLKRKTFMNDPDRGHMTWIYDDAANLIESIDAKSQRITYTYDGANRILTEDYHDGVLPLYVPSGPITPKNRPDLAYFYDVPVPDLDHGDTTTGTARNTKGMLAYVWDLSGEEHTSYDLRGRIEYTVKRIPDPIFAPQGARTTNYFSLVSYKTGFDYDSLDRLVRLTYPDNDEITYHYNDRNLPDEIRGGINELTQNGQIISGLRYWPSAQQARINYGNGVRTTYAHDSRLRLKTLRTVRPDSVEPPSSTDLIHFGYDFDSANNITAIHDRRPASAVPGGDPRRNTQIFRYDDIYRLMRAQYSFNLPGAAPRNDGEINYRYDRIGNMLAQTSTIDQNEKGLPVANLGQMESGGTLGRWNRSGRSANDPPGPHALTSIGDRQSTISDRNYNYDANGNMLAIDGITNTWDFKDRLLAVESSEMAAYYSYDYTDRRITKRVIPKQVATDKGPLTTIYVSKYFEVREHDAPTKYVWNGETRVARCTSSLTRSTRTQRLRLYPGWNLVSLAVTVTNLQSSGLNNQSSISAAFSWRQSALDWEPVSLPASLPAGTVLWLYATNNAMLPFVGAYPGSHPHLCALPEGAFLPSAGLEVWDLNSTSDHQLSTAAWLFAGDSQSWISNLPPPLPRSRELMNLGAHAFVSPGSAFFVQAAYSVELKPPDITLGLCYYHQDHLASSTYISDARGGLVEESTFYPFGYLRHEIKVHRVRSAYAFTQKERDQESNFNYFEARFYIPTIGRFNVVDPLAKAFSSEWLEIPQKLNSYAYCYNRPIICVDPSGMVGVEDQGIYDDMQYQPGTLSSSASTHAIPSITIDAASLGIDLGDIALRGGLPSKLDLVGLTFSSIELMSYAVQDPELAEVVGLVGDFGGTATAATAIAVGSGGTLAWLSLGIGGYEIADFATDGYLSGRGAVDLADFLERHNVGKFDQDPPGYSQFPTHRQILAEEARALDYSRITVTIGNRIYRGGTGEQIGVVR